MFDLWFLKWFDTTCKDFNSLVFDAVKTSPNLVDYTIAKSSYHQSRAAIHSESIVKSLYQKNRSYVLVQSNHSFDLFNQNNYVKLCVLEFSGHINGQIVSNPMIELFGSQMPRITNVTFLKMAIHQHMTANPSRGHTYQISISPLFSCNSRHTTTILLKLSMRKTGWAPLWQSHLLRSTLMLFVFPIFPILSLKGSDLCWGPLHDMINE
jgi:hypothetical protein